MVSAAWLLGLQFPAGLLNIHLMMQELSCLLRGKVFVLNVDKTRPLTNPLSRVVQSFHIQEVKLGVKLFWNSSLLAVMFPGTWGETQNTNRILGGE